MSNPERSAHGVTPAGAFGRSSGYRPDNRMHSVYIVETQELFGPELERLVTLAGGRYSSAM